MEEHKNEIPIADGEEIEETNIKETNTKETNIKEANTKEINETEDVNETVNVADQHDADPAADGEEAGTDADCEEEDLPDDEENTDAQGEQESAASRKGFFRKNKKKDKKDEKIEELTDQVRRQMAEFDNFRKRTEKEKTGMYEIGAKSIIEKVLPVVDNFERGLAAVPEENKEDAFVEGMNKVYKQMMTMLEEAGVAPIEAVGKEFDPNLHNAVMQTESEEYESGVVAQELQKGYTYRDSVVRHSMVAVVS